jgi:hypothetical protein
MPSEQFCLWADHWMNETGLLFAAIRQRRHQVSCWLDFICYRCMD